MSVAPPRPPIATGFSPPHSLEAEQSVLGAVLLSSNIFPKLRLEEALAAEHFYRDKHRAIWTAMCELHGRGDEIDVLTVSAELDRRGLLQEIGGKAAIDELTGGVPGLGGFRSYARIVSEHWIARERLASSYEQQAVILNHGSEEDYQAALARAHAVVAAGVDDGYLGKDALADHMMQWYFAPVEESLPLPPELPSLADMVVLRPGHTVILAAFPSGGKTATALALGRALGFAGQRTVIWTNEDTAEELTAKHVQTMTDVPSWQITKKCVPEQRLKDVTSAFMDVPFEIQPCADWTAQQIATHIRQVAPAVAIVDHFHNMAGISLVSDIDESLRALAAAAAQTGTLLIICAQLNSARLTGVCKPPPVARDLRGSGMFLATAHVLLLVHRDEEEIEDDEHGKMGKARQLDTGSVDVAKNKVTGKTGVITVLFDTKRIRFVEPAHSSHGAPLTPTPGSPEDLGF